MKRLIRYLKNKQMLTILFLMIMLISGMGFLNQLGEQRAFDHITIERTMMQAYEPTIRQQLFHQVIGKEEYDLLPILGECLEQTLYTMGNRIRFRRADLSRNWKPLFKPYSEVVSYRPEVKDLCYIMLNQTSLQAHTRFFNSLSQFEAPTPAEKEIMQSIWEVWKTFDKQLQLQGLNSADYSVKNIYSTSFAPADDLAQHFYDLNKALNQLPRPLSCFNPDFSRCSEVVIVDILTKATKTITEPEAVKKLVNMLRTTGYSNVLEPTSSGQNSFIQPRYDLKLGYYYTQFNKKEYREINRMKIAENNVETIPSYRTDIWANSEVYTAIKDDLGVSLTVKGIYAIEFDLVEKITNYLNNINT